jgi:hypothetical protein
LGSGARTCRGLGLGKDGGREEGPGDLVVEEDEVEDDLDAVVVEQKELELDRGPHHDEDHHVSYRQRQKPAPSGMDEMWEGLAH